MTGDPKWHERTPTLLAASVAALAAIGLVVWLTMFVVRQAGTPEPPPEYVTPTFTDVSGASPTTTTSTVTSTVPPQTSDILVPPITESTTSTTTRVLTPPRTRENNDDEEDEDTSTNRRRPRFNETRTLYPVP